VQSRRHPRLTAALLSVLLAAALLGGGVASAPPAEAYPSNQIELVRRGLGHGRGMSQWGALGYAVGSGWSHTQILEHYYRGTTAGTVGNDTVTVQMTKFNDADTIVHQERGRAEIEGLPGQYGAVRVRRGAPGQFVVEVGDHCGGPNWTPVATQGAVRIRPAAGLTEDRQEMLQLCESNPVQNRWVRGNVLAVNAAGATGASDRVTLNELPMEAYLKGVVPRESPASWGNLGGGRGQQALMAQAVAARSYAHASDVPGPARTCDTTACQVYGGRAVQGSAFTDLEATNTNRAVDDTAGQVRMRNGAVDRTEFSASTGGWTARAEDGNKYGAVEDAGDGYCTSEVCNPLHESNVTVAVSVIEAKYGLGTLERIDVLARNGLGADGGRVTRLRFVFSGGERTFEGEEQVRSAMGIGSSWFRVLNPPASFPYHVVTRDGGVFSFGGAQFHGSLPGIGVRTPARDITEGPGGGYWILGEDGGVFSFGPVEFHGSMGGQRLNSPVVGMQSTASRRGYWLVAGDGGIFTFGDAPFFGSTGNLRLNRPVVAMAPTGGGGGYWMVATDGGIFTFGDAPFLGSTGDIRLNQPVFAMAPTPSGQGYWLVARDGGIFTFGDAAFHGSLPGRNIGETAVELLPSPSGNGYLIVTAQGRVHAFGDAVSGVGPADVGAGPSPAVGAGRVQ
jgi:peptidoglycan hydrolase-like amidase